MRILLVTCAHTEELALYRQFTDNGLCPPSIWLITLMKWYFNIKVHVNVNAETEVTIYM